MKKGNTKILDYKLDKAWPENNLLEIEITGDSHPFVYLLMNSPGELFLENWINEINLMIERSYPMTADGMKEQFKNFCLKELMKHNMIKTLPQPSAQENAIMDLREEFESTGYTTWINSDLYPDGKIYTKEYTEWLEQNLLIFHLGPSGFIVDDLPSIPKK